MTRLREGREGGSRTRREFLQTSKVAVGGAALGALARPTVVCAGGRDVVRVGLIGCGQRGTGAALQAIQADAGVRIVALADIFEDHVERARERLRRESPTQADVSKDRCFVGFDAYRGVIDSGVDVVLIACTSRFHPEYLRACVDAGKHVFVEKPHAIDPPGVHVVTAACAEARKKNVCVVSGLHRRYDRSVQETRGAIGAIVAMEVSFMRSPYRVIPRNPKWSEIEWQFRSWYHFRWLSGDDVVQSLIHTIDVATWAMGDRAPRDAHALAGRSASIGEEFGDVFDHSAVVYEYASGVKLYGFVRTQSGCHAEVGVQLIGTKGRAFEGRIEGENPWRYEKPRRGGHAQEQIDFFAALRAGKTINNESYMARSTMIALMGQAAAYTGKKVTWENINRSRFTYPPSSEEIQFRSVPPVSRDQDGVYPTAIPGITTML